MSLKLQSSGGGSVTIADPASTASNFTLNPPLANDTLAVLGAQTFTGQQTIPTINLTGGQIKFPATQVPSADANTLDDYEEGTWTCNINGSSGTGVNITANYTKIGRVVHCLIDFYNQNINSTVGHLRITLPFAVSGSAQGLVAISATSFDVAMIEPASNNTIAYLYRDGNGGADMGTLTKADWSSPTGVSIRGQFSYLI